MKTPTYFVVNTKTKKTLGKFKSFSTAKRFRNIQPGFLEGKIKIWGYYPKETFGVDIADEG